MLLGTFLLLFSSASTVKSYFTNWPPYSTLDTSTETDNLPHLQLVATPDYPGVAGQTVELYCNTTIAPHFRFSWQRLESQTWREVAQGLRLTLNEPKQSGLYRCRAENQYYQKESNVITVYIIATQPTVAEKLGIIGFVLSLLALIATLTILCWLSWQRFGGTLTPLNTAAKGKEHHRDVSHRLKVTEVCT
ncbi:uncharacterized protein [Paralichthys olivaceus]|uniref:uncharacterized protein isoform X2 n=1 Tax=Paralichthys olivaceus TaxID=8255 RepID=UPI003753120E